MTYLLDILVGALCAALCGMGVGGGGLLVVYMTLSRSIPQIKAQGINLVFFIAAAAAALFVHIKKRHIAVLPIVIASLGALVGTYFGSTCAQALSGELLRKLFGGFLLLAGIFCCAKLIKEKK